MNFVMLFRVISKDLLTEGYPKVRQ